MANGEITGECPHCGQKLRGDWLRCPRCRELVAETFVAAAEPEPPLPEASSSGLKAMIGPAMLIVVLGLGAVIWGARVANDATSSSATSEGRTDTTASAREAKPVDATELALHQADDERRLGAAAYHQGDMQTALARFQAAVDANPNDAEARNNLAQVLVRLDRAADALPHLDEAVRLEPAQWAYRFNRGRANAQVNAFEQAIADYRAATEMFPDDYVTHYNLGVVYLATKQYPEAVQALERAASLAPGEPSFLISLGTAYVGVQQPDKAKTTFEKYLEVAADDDPEVPRVKALIEAFEGARSGT